MDINVSNCISDSILNLLESSECIGVLVKDDRGRTAAKDSFIAGILIGS